MAVIGGGCAAMTAAFELTRPELDGKYRVTVYQQGWRLGGKGASGRGTHDRIEEHGLHVWLGFYENAFRIMRDCYAEANRDPKTCPIATWRDAFVPEPNVGVAEWSVDRGWSPWTAIFPPAPGEPGDPLERDNPFTVSAYLVRLVQTVRALLSHAGQTWDDEPAGPDDSRPILDRIQRLVDYGQLATMAAVLEALHALETLFAAVLPFPQGPVLALVDSLAAGLAAQIRTLSTRREDLRRAWQIVDLVLAITRGCVRHGLVFDPRGFDALDEYDCRQWMRSHGAAEESVNCAFVRGLYDLAFGYRRGDPKQPAIAAGQAIRGALRMFFTYRGQLFWKMQAGMGDVVFAPMYEVLSKRGVRFEFFHRLEDVVIEEDEPGSPHVSTLRFDVQADVIDGTYRPLVDVRGLPCWPAAPLYEQLRRGNELRRRGVQFESFWDRRRERSVDLRVGRDFDFVVLGVPIGVIPHVCGKILARDRRWREMVEHVGTVATQAFQLWMREDMRALGWPGPAVTLSGFTEPFDTWADMRHLLGAESWGRDVRSIAYFCNALEDDPHEPPRPSAGEHADYVARREGQVRTNAQRFLDRDVQHLWPRAVADPTSGFRWDVLAGAPNSARGSQRLAAQWFSANVSPSERYTLALPGSGKYRISPLDGTYDNLTICGDWTDAGFNEGCVEAAVMSGRLAAHALSVHPPLESIIGYDGP